MITSEAFQESFFYIGGGMDWQPLKRFSHYCPTFIYVNVYYGRKEIKDSLNALNYATGSALRLLPLEERIIKNVAEYFTLERGFEKHFLHGFNVFTEQERSSYDGNFNSARNEEYWVLEANFLVNSTNRSIKLYYIMAEGLATYAVLSRGGKIAPRAICTIQTGGLDAPNDLFTRFMNSYTQKPKLWVRGFEPDFMEDEDGSSSRTIFAKDILYDAVACDFGNPWDVNQSYFGNKNRPIRYAKAYMMSAEPPKGVHYPFKHYGRHQIHNMGLEQIPDMRHLGRQLVISSRRLNDRIPRFLRAADKQFWDHRFWRNRKVSLKETLDYVEELDNGTYASIWFTLHGFEDEGCLLEDFLRKVHHAAMHVLAYRPFDLIDLRESA